MLRHEPADGDERRRHHGMACPQGEPRRIGPRRQCHPVQQVDQAEAEYDGREEDGRPIEQ